MDVYKLFIGDDTNGDFGRKFFFTPISDLDLTDCIGQFTVAGVTKTFTNLVSGEPQELVFTRAQTGSMKRGMYRATLAIYDSTGRHRTIANDILVKVTDVVDEVYSGVDNSIRFTVDSGVSWEGISNKPPLVTKTELGEALANIDISDVATQRDVRQALQSLVAALKGLAVCVAAMFCLASFGIDYTTEWQDVPPTNTVKDVVDLFAPTADFTTNNTQLVETIEATSPTADFTTNNVQLVNTIEATSPTPDFSTNNTALVDTIDAVSQPPANYANVSNAAMNAASRVDPTITNMIRLVGYGNANWELSGAQTGWYFTDSNGNAYRIELNSDSFATSNDVGSASNVLLASRKWVYDRYLPKSGGTVSGGITVWGDSTFYGNVFSFSDTFKIKFMDAVMTPYLEIFGYGIMFPLENGTLALTSDIPTSMAWGAITSKPTTLSGYGITDALKADFSTLTNNAAFTSAVAEISPPVDISDYCTTGEAAGIASNVVSQAYIRQKLGVYLYVGEDGGIYVHTNED